jgi:hypothetical protein
MYTYVPRYENRPLQDTNGVIFRTETLPFSGHEYCPFKSMKAGFS